MQYEYELVQNIIDTYHQDGLEAVAAKRWNLGGGRWERNTSSALNILEQWCADNDTHEVFTVFQDYMKRTENLTQQVYDALLAGDFETVEQLNSQRTDVVCAVVFVWGVYHNRADFIQWACEHVGEQWDNCFAQVFSIVSQSNGLHGLTTVLGGWCAQCNTAHCMSHNKQWFLNSSHLGLLAQVLDQRTQNSAYLAVQDLHPHTRKILELMREHPIWDNTHLYIQTCAKRLVMQAARAGDVNSLKLLIGPNDRDLSESEHKQLICVNREDITQALVMQCQNRKTLARIAPVFAGLVDGDTLINNPYLVDFLVLHQQTVLNKVTNNVGALRPRKM